MQPSIAPSAAAKPRQIRTVAQVSVEMLHVRLTVVIKNIRLKSDANHAICQLKRCPIKNKKRNASK